ncbi:MAG: efflux RND transporter periplasmic adaptor subunit [Candidatus Aminicenantaceae bacterium]
MKSKKFLIFLAVVAVIAVIVLSNLQSKREKAIKVSVEKVSTDDLAAIISASGEVKPKKSVNISAQIPGRVVKIAVEEGQTVQEGDFLLKLEAIQYEANAERDRAFIRSLNAELIKAEAYFKRDERNLDRQKNLWDKQLISREELEAASSEYDISNAGKDAIIYQIRQAQASLKSTLDNIEKTVYTSPIAGIIASLQVEEGETALVGTMNNPGTVLMTIADLSVMEVEVEVDETDVVALEIGHPAEVQVDAFPDRIVSGRVTEIGSSALAKITASEESRDFKVVITLVDPPSSLKPGLSASADIITAERKNVIAVPISALIIKEDSGGSSSSRRGGKQIEGLYVVGPDSRVTFTPIIKGIMGELQVEITSGLEGGQTIVVGPYSALRQLKDGTLVKPEAKSEGE